jgi:hypothetical protein
VQKKLEELKAARGKPESSIIANVELTLAKFLVSHAAYHGGDFNGVCCRRLVRNAKVITEEIKPILVSKKESCCEETEIDKKMDTVENTLGLLDAAFSYLNLLHPTDEEKQKARIAVNTLMQFWRNKTGLSVSLKGHVMEKHACNFNDACGLGDKEESFVEQGHQVGIKDDRRYYGLTNFVKRSESTMKARHVSSHPLVKENQDKVLGFSKRKRLEPNNDGEPKKGKARVKKEDVKKEIKRESYVRMNSQDDQGK